LILRKDRNRSNHKQGTDRHANAQRSACGRVVSTLAPLFFGMVAARYGIAVAFRLGALAWILTIIGYLLSRETSGIALERIEGEAAFAATQPAAAPLAQPSE
jgi:hypothetical protein